MRQDSGFAGPFRRSSRRAVLDGSLKERMWSWVRSSMHRQAAAACSASIAPMERERTLIYEGGPRDAQTDTIDHLAAVIGTGEDGGVYQLTAEVREGRNVYRWQPLSDAEAKAVVRGDLRSSQNPE